MGRRSELGVGSVCCLLHSLVAGGSTRQWVHLLGRHVEGGGEATIYAPSGPLAGAARAAGIRVVSTTWSGATAPARRGLWRSVGHHELAIVHWDHEVMDGFVPALEACGRAALSIHQGPRALARWFGPEVVEKIRVPIEAAIAEPSGVPLVRGESHRHRIAAAFDLPAEGFRVLPASIPLADTPFRPARAEPEEVLALMRLSPEKAPVAQLAIELTAAGLAAGRSCRLAIAGEGPWHEEVAALCRRHLPPGSWTIEAAPHDPIARLAASDLVVAQGLTTLEAAALGRRVVVARAAGEDAAAGAVLTPERYDEVARDPFGEPAVSTDVERLWREVLALGESELEALRGLVQSRNSLALASRALGDALASTGGRLDRLATRLRR